MKRLKRVWLALLEHLESVSHDLTFDRPMTPDERRRRRQVNQERRARYGNP